MFNKPNVVARKTYINYNFIGHYNKILGKFVRSKKVFFPARGGYYSRCFAALISYYVKRKYYSEKTRKTATRQEYIHKQILDEASMES